MGVSIIKKAMPWVGTLISAAVPSSGPLVTIASKLLSNGLGKSVAANADSISSAITEAMANPDQLAKLKQIDDDFSVQMKTLDIQSVDDLEKTAEADRASAREMQVQTKSKTPTMLAWVSILTLAFCIYMLGFRTLPTTGHDALMLLIGAVVGICKDVYGYFFGSSAGSDRKTELLVQSSPATASK